LIIVIVLLVISIVLNIAQANENSALEDSIEDVHNFYSSVQSENNQLKKELDEVSDELEFYNDHVVFVEDDGTKLYHKYHCYKFKGRYFWAYNTEAAEDYGYSPCSWCCE
jgi:hypothetical protein